MRIASLVTRIRRGCKAAGKQRLAAVVVATLFVAVTFAGIYSYLTRPSLDLVGESSQVAASVQPVFKLAHIAKAEAREVKLVKGGQTISVEPVLTQEADGSLKITVPPVTSFKPGKYLLSVSFDRGRGLETITQDFSWGVLAFNVYQQPHVVGDQVTMGLAVLDDAGVTICDAGVELEVKKPSGEVVRPEILKSDICADKFVTDIPDYKSTIAADQAGTYNVQLTAQTVNGERSLQDKFEVVASAPSSIKRETSMRIYPKAEYTVSLTAISATSGKQTIRELVPNVFSISGLRKVGVVKQLDSQLQEITWEVDLEAGKPHTVSYTYDAPDITPQFYLLGPASVGSFTEYRTWQIASDEVGSASSNRIWSSGAELNSITDNMEVTSSSGTTKSVDATVKRSGDYSYKATTSSNTATIYKTWANSAQSAKFWFRAYVRVDTAPGVEMAILKVGTTTNNKIGVRMNTDRTIELWNEEDSAQIGSASSALTLATWYRVEIFIDTTTLSSTDATLKLDGVTTASSTAENLAAGIDRLTWGVLTSTTSVMYFDDIAINGDTTKADNWPGEGKIVHMQGDADGDNEAWTGSPNNTDDYDDINEVTPSDSTGGGMYSATNNAVSEMNMESATSAGLTAGDTVKLVSVGARMQTCGGNDTGWGGGAVPACLGFDVDINYKTRIRASSGGTVEDSGNIGVLDTTSGWFTNDDDTAKLPKLTLYDLPGATTFTPWTTAALDTTQIGVSNHDTSTGFKSTAVWLLVEYTPASGGRLYSSGFELNSVADDMEFSSSPQGDPSISTGTVRSGTYSLQSDMSATAEFARYNFAAANVSGHYYLRSYVRVATLPDTDVRIMSFNESASNTRRVYIVMKTTGALELWDEDGQIGSASSALSTGTWYRVELKADLTPAGGSQVIEGRIDGSSFATSSTRNISTGLVSFDLGFYAGCTAICSVSQTTGDIFFDDVALNEAVGASQNSWPGAGAIIHLTPNAAGDNSAWTNTYTNIDDTTPPNDATDVVSETTTNDILDVNLTDSSLTSEVISLVAAGVRFRSNTATEEDFKVRLKDAASGNTIESNTLSPASTTFKTNASTAPNLYPITAYTRPEQSTAWTDTELDAAQIGFRDTAGSGTAEVSAAWLLVEYQPIVLITVSGTIYSDEGSTVYDCSADNLTIGVAVNGGSTATATCTASGGTYTATVNANPSAAGNPIAVWIDSAETPKATTVTRAADTTSNITGFNLYQSRVIVRHEDAGPIINGNLNTANNANAGIRYSISSGNITFESGMTLYIWGSKTYQPTGDVTTSTTGGDLKIASGGVFKPGANNVYIGGSWNNSGTFTGGTSTVTFTATGTGKTLSGTLDTSTGRFVNLVFDGVGGGWSNSAALEVTTDLTMTNGTLSGTNNVTVNGNVVGTAGIITLTGGTFEQRLSGSKNFGTSSGSNQWTFANLTFSSGCVSICGGRTVTTQTGGTGKIRVTGVLLVGKSGDAAGASTSLNAGNREWELTGTGGDPFQLLAIPTGSLSAATSIFNYLGANAGGNTTIQFATYCNLTIGGTTADTYVLEAATTTSNAASCGDFTTTAPLSSTTIVDVVSGSNYGLTVGGNVSLASSTQFSAQSGTVTLSATDAGNTINGAFSSTSSFYNLTFNGSGGAWSFGATTIAVTNTFTITNGTVTAPSSSLTIGNSYSNAGTFTHNSGTVTFNSTSTGRTLAGTMTTTSSFYNLTFNGVGGAWSFSAAATVANNLTITNGTVTAPSATLTVAGSYSNAGTFTHNSGTVTFSSTASGKTLAGTMTSTSAFYNLIFDGVSGAWTFSNPVAAANDFTVTNGGVTASNNNLTVTRHMSLANTSGVVYTAGSSTITVGGDYADAGGKGVYGTSTVDLTGTGTITTVASTAFYNLNMAASTKTTSTGSSVIRVTNVLTIGAGTATSTGGYVELRRTTTGSPLVLNASATLSGTAKTFYFTSLANALTLTIPGGNYGTWPISCFGSTGGNNLTCLLGGNVTTTGSLTLESANAITGSVFDTSSSGNYSLTAGSIQVTNAPLSREGAWTFNANASVVTLSNGTSDALWTPSPTGSVTSTINMGTSSWNVRGNTKLVNGSSVININVGTGTMTFNPGSAQSNTFTPNGQSFYNIVLNGAASTSTLLLGGAMAATNNLTITRGILDVDTTGNYGVTVGGSYSNSGTFTARAGTTTFTATSTGKTIAGTLNNTSAFYNLTFNGVGGGWTHSSGMEVGRDLTVTNGAFVSAATLSVFRDLILVDTSGVSYSPGSNTVTVLRDFTDTNGARFTYGTSTLRMTQTGTLTTLSVYNLSVGYTGYTTTFAGSYVTGIYGTLTFNGGTVTASTGYSNVICTATCTPVVFATPTTLSGTRLLSYRVSSGSSVVVSMAGANYGSWQVGTYVSGTNNTVYNFQGNVTTTTDLLYSVANGVTGTVFNTGNFDITAARYIIGDGTAGRDGAGTHNFGSSVVTLSSSSSALYPTSTNNTTNHVLNLGASRITVVGTVLFVNSTGGMTVNPGTSTLTFAPPSATTTGFYPNGQSLYNMGVDGAGTLQLEGAVDVDNDLTIRAGTLDTKSGSNYGITIGKNWSNTGTFTARSGTVTFNDVTKTSTIAGTTSFYSLTSTTPLKALRFTSGTTFTITGVLTLTGSVGNPVSVASTTSGSKWTVYHQGTESVTYTSVTDSGCHGSSTAITMDSTNTNGGNNDSCWQFAFIVSGTVYDTDGVTVVTTGPTVRLKLNGAGSYTAVANGSGVYSIADVPAVANDVVLVYLDTGGGIKGEVYTRVPATSQVLNIYRNRSTLRCDVNTDCKLTSGNIDLYDGDNDGDINIALNLGNLQVQATSTLSIRGGFLASTSELDGFIAYGNVEILSGGTFANDSVLLTFYGSYSNAGTFSSASETVKFAATGTGKTISGTLTGTTGKMNNVEFNGIGGGWTYGAAAEVGNLTIANGTIVAPSSTFTVRGSVARTGGTFTHNSGKVVFTGDIGSVNTLSGTFTGSNAFYKAEVGESRFSTTDFDFEFESSVEFAAANATDTLVVKGGNIVLGNGSATFTAAGGVQIATGTGERALVGFASASTFDLNANTSTPSCANCIITVGAASGSGSGELAVGGLLRLNPRSSATASDTGLVVQSTGKLTVLGSLGQDGTTSTALDTVALRETKICANAVLGGYYVGSTVRMASGLAQGRIYPITASTTDDTNCGTNSHDSVTRTSTASTTETTPVVTGSGSTRTLRLSTQNGIITASGDHVGRYVHNLVDDTYFRIVKSTNSFSLSSDTVVIVAEPDSLSGMATNDDIEITDGVRPGDTFDVITYASITAEAGTACNAAVGGVGEAYISAGAGAEVSIQYGQICNMGGSTSGKYGVLLTGIDGSNSSEGVTIKRSKFINNSSPLILDSVVNNTGTKGIFTTNFSGNTSAIDLAGGSNIELNGNFIDQAAAVTMDATNDLLFTGNTLINTSEPTFTGAYGLTFSSNTYACSVGTDNGLVLSTVYASLISSNSFMGCGSALKLQTSSSGNRVSSNTFYGNSEGVYLDSGSNVFSSNTLYGNSTGISSYVYDVPNTYRSNTIQGNTVGVLIDGDRDPIFSGNSIYGNDTGITLETGAYDAAAHLVSLGDTFGSPTANVSADISAVGAAESVVQAFSSTFASTTVFVGFSAGEGNSAILYYRDASSATNQIYGDYSIPSNDVTTTTVDESVLRISDTASTWSDRTFLSAQDPGGATGVGTAMYTGATAAMAGSATNYTYQIICAQANCSTTPNSWSVYRNGTLLTATASTEVQYVDTQTDGGSTPKVTFTIPKSSVGNYGKGYNITFTSRKSASDCCLNKAFTVMSDGSTITVPSGTTLNLHGEVESSGSSLQPTTPTTTYSLVNNGAVTLDYGNLYVSGSFTGSGTVTATGGSGNVYMEAGSSAAKMYGTTSGSNQWKVDSLMFRNRSAGAGVAYTVASGGTGSVKVSGFMSVGHVSDTQTTTVTNATNNRTLDLTTIDIAANGIITASATAPMRVEGAWYNLGTFNANGGTVTFTGSGLAILSGTTTFANLTISNPTSKTVNFPTAGGSIIHVTGTFTAQSLIGQPHTLQSATGGSKWHFHPTGTYAIDNVRVKDGGCESGAITMNVSNSTDLGNNESCWVFNDTTGESNRLNSGTIRTGGGTIRVK